MKAVYKQLLKIKKPVMLIVYNPKESYKDYRELDRVRILSPNGLSEYVYDFRKERDVDFSKSCFIDDIERLTLSRCIKEMSAYDASNDLEIIVVKL